MLSRFMMNLYERERAGRSKGATSVRTDSAIAGARLAWREAADDLGFLLDDEGLPCLRGLWDGAPADLAVLVDHDEMPFMRASLAHEREDGAPFHIEPRQLLHRLRRCHKTGNDEFDRAYAVTGDADSSARALTADVQEALLRLHYRTPTVVAKPGRVVLEASGVELDPARIRELMSLLGTLAQRPTREQTAYR
jgi:hypothetical protein